MSPRTETPSRARQAVEIVILAAVYFGAARLGLAINAVSGFATLVWPPTGISIAALLIFGYRLWPGVLLGAFLANATVGAPIPVALSIGIGNMLEAVVAVYLFRRGGFHVGLERVRDVLGFVILCVLFSTAVSPSIGVSSLWIAGKIDSGGFGYTWMTWWIGDAIGALVVCPLITAWLRTPPQGHSFLRKLEAAILVVVLAAVAMINFGDWFQPALARYIRPYYIFPVLIWAALRFGQKGATTSTFVLSIVAIWFESLGSGPFEGHTIDERLLALQMFMGVVALTTLCLAAAGAERREAIESLQTARDELEDRVRLRTVQLSEVNRMLTEAQEQAHIGSWEWNIVENRITWSDELYDIYGVNRKGFEGTYESFLTAVHPDDRARVKARVEQSERTGEPFAFDHRIVRPDGIVRIVHGEGKVIKSDAGIPERMAGTSQDITERWQAEEEVRKLNDELEQRVRERTAELAGVNDALAHEIGERIQAEETLFQSRERYRGFFENSPISLWEEDFSEVKKFVDGLRAKGVSDVALHFRTHPEAVAECAAKVKVVDVNQATLRLYEARSKSDFLEGLQRVLSRESYQVFREEVIAVAQGKTVFESEDVNKTFRGETINIYLKWSVPPGSEETYSTVLVSIVDMTVHKRAQEALIKFAAIIESSDDAIISQTTEGIITSWNRGAERVYGYAAEDMIGRPISTLIPADHPDDLRQILDTIKRGEALEHYETECLHKDGRRIMLSLTVSPITEEAGWISGASTTGRDITQQRQTEKQIRLLAQALESTTEMICITNLENRIIFANRAFLDKYGYAEKEILGKFPDVVRSPSTSPELSRQIFEHSRRRGWAGELLNRTKDGRDFPVFLSTSQIRDGKGTVLGLIGVARDISEIAKAEEVLWQAAVRIERLFDTGSEERLPSAEGFQRLGTDPARRRHDLARDINEVVEKIRARAQRTLSLSSMASHQLRTPLTILRSQLENALRPDLSSQSLRRALSETYDEVLHLTRVVDELLSLSRMQAGTFKLDLTDINFYDLLREFYRESQILTREKKISMVLRKGPPVSIRADPGQMRHILFNLLDNAIKFTPAKGRIRLSYTAEEHELVFRFFNSGKGISSEILPNIFDPFRSGQSESSMGGGTGLGLALVKWIVESHRGSVEARNDAREGTAFVIRLPIHPVS